eukprot:g13041.t1
MSAPTARPLPASVQIELFLEDGGDSRLLSEHELVSSGLFFRKLAQLSNVGYHPTPDEGVYLHVARLKDYVFETLGGRELLASTGGGEIAPTLAGIRAAAQSARRAQAGPSRLHGHGGHDETSAAVEDAGGVLVGEQEDVVSNGASTRGAEVEDVHLPPNRRRGAKTGTSEPSVGGPTVEVHKGRYDGRFAARALSVSSFLQVVSPVFCGDKWVPSARFLQLSLVPRSSDRDVGTRYRLAVPLCDREFIFVPQLKPKEIRHNDYQRFDTRSELWNCKRCELGLKLFAVWESQFSTLYRNPSRSFVYSTATLVEAEARAEFYSMLEGSGVCYEASRSEFDAVDGSIFLVHAPEYKCRIQEKVLAWRREGTTPLGLRVCLRRSPGCGILSLYPEGVSGVRKGRTGWAEGFFHRRDDVATGIRHDLEKRVRDFQRWQNINDHEATDNSAHNME